MLNMNMQLYLCVFICCRTHKKGCPAEIKIRAKKKTYLEITKFVSEHNHAVDRPLFHHEDSDQEDSDQEDSRLMVEAKQQEDSCTSLGNLNTLVIT